MARIIACCNCPKFYRYSRHGKQRRESVNTRSWATAEDGAKALEARLNSATTSTASTDTAKQPDASTILQVVETFIRRKESESLNQSTIRELPCQFDLFEQFMSARSKFYARDIRPQDLIDFRSSWKWGDLSRIKAQQNLRGFIQFACKGDH